MLEDLKCSKPIEVHATKALGCGFDLASDFRLKFVKRCPKGGSGRLVLLDQQRKRDVVVPYGVIIADVPECIHADKGDHIRFKSDVLQFNQNYGTHIVVGMAVGGQYLLSVKQRPSLIPPAELKGYLEQLGDCLFSDENSPILERTSKVNLKKVP